MKLRLAMVLAMLLGAATVAEARIVKLEITRVESPAFGGAAFGGVGTYDRLVGRAHGEVDPSHPLNAIIQDIELAPRNARGMVEYSTDVDILKPTDAARGNGVLFFNVVNRGNKGGLISYNAGAGGDLSSNNRVASPGDGFMMREGYSIIWFGWQADVLAGNDRVTMQVPVARHPDGTPITGVVRSEIVVWAPTPTVNLSTGHYTQLTHASYPTVSLDNRVPLPGGFVPTLTVRARERDPRQPIPNTEWSFGACPGSAPAQANDRQVCYPAGFQPGRLYELIYRAKDPLVLGLGYAAMRDLAAFFKHEGRDVNPLFRPGSKAVIQGSSQSGRNIRTFLHLGFNQDERGRIAYDGAFPHIGGGLAALNIRFAHPGRAWGEQIEHLYPAYDSSGIITIEPPREGARAYRLLVPRVDADGNDVAGIRSVHLRVPVGTYTGWNLFGAGRFEDGFCSLQGTFVPFARTRAERRATGDPRPSIEERYPTREACVTAIRAAAADLVKQRCLLADDAAALVAEAEWGGVRIAP